MEINLQKENFGFGSVIYDKVIEQSITAELNLPDYMPDILRVVKASISPRINSVNTVGDRITVDGCCEAQLIYCCENGELHTYSQTQDFSRYAECSEVLGTDVVSARAVCDYANCRAMSPKRAEIKGSVSLPIRITRKDNQEILVGADGIGIQLKTQPISAVSVTALGEKSFSMSDVFELPENRDTIKSVAYASAFATLGEVKQINNKLMLRGELSVDIAYIPESKVSSIEHITHSLPISQIVELEGITEGSLCDISMSAPAIEIVAKPKADNSLRLLDISASVTAAITASEQKETTVIMDAYSTLNSVDIKTDTRNLLTFAEKLNESFLIRESIDVSQNAVSTITDMRIEDITCSTSVSESDIAVSGTVKAGIIFTDKDSQVNYMERLLDYTYSFPNKSGKQLHFEPKVIVTGSSYVYTSAEKLDIKIEAVVNGNIYCESPVTCVYEIINLGERDRSSNCRGVTIYFAQENESLWSIARRYNTTVDAIAEENDIASDVIAEKQMLIIPSI